METNLISDAELLDQTFPGGARRLQANITNKLLLRVKPTGKNKK